MAVVSHNGRDRVQDRGSLQVPRFGISKQGCSTAAAPAQDRHLAGSGIESSVISGN